ncbi:MAG: tyrosine--tRNA ligase [Actinobacteria bacterium]|nr:tyrosine--tRNA ligase [Actinomycetota bacterium]
MTSSDLARLLSGAAEVVPRDGLAQKLALGRALRVKLGLDPTAAEVTLGWAVVLRKLRQFQDAGHTAVLIVGDFTARVGDPSGRSETRPRLERDEVRAYADRLLEQFDKVLSSERLEVRYNSEWLEGMDMEAVLRLTASYTVARMLERDDFAKRYAEGRPISVMEFLYPLLQGMDSVAVRADVELGGTDQKFNLLVGRELQRDYGQEPQVALTMPLLEGLDGVQKMSQSLGNYVGIAEPAGDMFGKLMSIPDGLIARYLRLCTDLDPEEVDRMEAGLADGSLHPGEQKRLMAREVVDLYHGPEAGAAAEARFDVVHREREIPDDIGEAEIPPGIEREGGMIWLPRLLTALGLASSNAEARRLIEQGGVKLDGEAVADGEAEFRRQDLEGRVVQVGRRKFLRLRAGDASGP